MTPARGEPKREKVEHAYWCNTRRLDKRMNDEGTIMYDDPCNCWAQYQTESEAPSEHR